MDKHCRNLRKDSNGNLFCGSTHVCYKPDCGILDGYKIVLHSKFVERFPVCVQLDLFAYEKD